MADLIDVDDVLTHAQLDAYLGGQLTAQTHLAAVGDADTDVVRTWALDDVLARLAMRTPPVYEVDVTIAAELRRAVRHGSAMHLYDLAMTSGADAELWHVKMKAEEKRYESAVDGLKPTVASGVQATAASFGISRR
jgi:hypothetical protein